MSLTVPGKPKFAVWTKLLRDDCAAQNKLLEFDGLAECILRILYENGLDPTVEALVRDGINGKARIPASRSDAGSRKLRSAGRLNA